MPEKNASLSHKAKRVAVDKIKPRLSDEAWTILRHPRAALSSWEPPASTRPSLTDLAEKYGTDKWGLHRYTPQYERHLQHLRDTEFTLLEIGIGGYSRAKQGGASLRMWKEYFPQAQIIGLDIEDKSFVNEPRIRSYRGSQVDPAILDRILADTGGVDVIVDDGSHRPEHIRETFAYLFPRLAPDGIYAIEDTQTSYWPNWGGTQDLHDPSSTMALVKDLVDGLHHPEFVDESYTPTYVDTHVVGVHAYHNLTIVDKGAHLDGNGTATKRRAIEASDQNHPAGTVAAQRAAHSVPPVVPR